MRNIFAVALLLTALSSLSGCLTSGEQYQRPRSVDTPLIYQDSPTPLGSIKSNPGG
jgi:hypothetical protein